MKNKCCTNVKVHFEIIRVCICVCIRDRPYLPFPLTRFMPLLYHVLHWAGLVAETALLMVTQTAINKNDISLSDGMCEKY